MCLIKRFFRGRSSTAENVNSYIHSIITEEISFADLYSLYFYAFKVLKILI